VEIIGRMLDYLLFTPLAYIYKGLIEWLSYLQDLPSSSYNPSKADA
jgi:hypothetical protein